MIQKAFVDGSMGLNFEQDFRNDSRVCAFIETCAAIFGETQDCSPSLASVQSRHSSLQLLDVPKIENGAQREAV